jgi:hypothetical protein
MFTREEVNKKIDEDSKGDVFFKHAIREGAYFAHYENVYQYYVDLAKAVKELRAQIDQLPKPLSVDLHMAAYRSFDINCAILHLDKIEAQCSPI